MSIGEAQDDIEKYQDLKHWFESQLDDERMASSDYDKYANWLSDVGNVFVDNENQYSDNVLRGMAADERRHYQYLQDIIGALDKVIAEKQAEISRQAQEDYNQLHLSTPSYHDYTSPGDSTSDAMRRLQEEENEREQRARVNPYAPGALPIPASYRDWEELAERIGAESGYSYTPDSQAALTNIRDGGYAAGEAKRWLLGKAAELGIS